MSESGASRGPGVENLQIAEFLRAIVQLARDTEFAGRQASFQQVELLRQLSAIIAEENSYPRGVVVDLVSELAKRAARHGEGSLAARLIAQYQAILAESQDFQVVRDEDLKHQQHWSIRSARPSNTAKGVVHETFNQPNLVILLDLGDFESIHSLVEWITSAAEAYETLHAGVSSADRLGWTLGVDSPLLPPIVVLVSRGQVSLEDTRRITEAGGIPIEKTDAFPREAATSEERANYLSELLGPPLSMSGVIASSADAPMDPRPLGWPKYEAIAHEVKLAPLPSLSREDYDQFRRRLAGERNGRTAGEWA